jgi:hypothetical protein
MVLRIFAGPFVERFSPTGMLLGASVLTGIGLLMFSMFATGLPVLMLSATIFACGVAFFFPTMVGYVSEQLPRTGSLGIVVFIGLGFLAAGSAAPVMGGIADRYLPDALPEAETLAILESVEDRYPGYLAQAQAAADNPAQLAALGYRPADVEAVIRSAQEALGHYRADGVLHGNSTGNTLRAMQDAGVAEEADLAAAAYAILRPADNYGGRMAFRWVAPIAFLVALIFLIMFIREKQRGGYRVVELSDHPEGTVDAREAFHEGPGGA